MKRTSITISVLPLLAFLACAGLAAAQPPSSVTPVAPAPPPAAATVSASSASAPAGQPTDNDFRKGAFYWSFLGGFSLPIDYKDSSSERTMGIFDVEVGRILTKRRGPGPLAGQFEYLLQGQATIVRGPGHFGGFGFTPILLRWTFAGGKQIRPTAEAGAGLMFINWPDPQPNQLALNFYEQIGFGVRIGRPSKTGVVAGFRYQHISNGGRAHPATGTDAYIVYGGVDFIQKSAKPAEASQGGGTGLIQSVTPDTLEPGNFAVGALEMNNDRNPGDIDIMKFGFQFAIGVTRRIEVFVDYVPALRTNAVNLDPLAYPVPPLDLIIDTYPTAANRTEPYFLFAQEVPYKTYDVPTVRVIPPSWGAFSQASGVGSLSHCPFWQSSSVHVAPSSQSDGSMHSSPVGTQPASGSHMKRYSHESLFGTFAQLPSSRHASSVQATPSSQSARPVHGGGPESTGVPALRASRSRASEQDVAATQIARKQIDFTPRIRTSPRAVRRRRPRPRRAPGRRGRSRRRSPRAAS